MHTRRNPQFTCYDYTCIMSAKYFQESTYLLCVLEKHGKHKVTRW